MVQAPPRPAPPKPRRAQEIGHYSCYRCRATYTKDEYLASFGRCHWWKCLGFLRRVA